MIVLKHYENAAAFAFLGSSCAAVSDRVLSTKLQIVRETVKKTEKTDCRKAV